MWGSDKLEWNIKLGEIPRAISTHESSPEIGDRRMGRDDGGSTSIFLSSASASKQPIRKLGRLALDQEPL